MGNNAFGQLGDGTTTSRNTPVQVATNVTSVAAGSSHSLYVTSDGKLWAMGRNYNGQLGDGTTINRSTPVPIVSNVAAVSAGGSHSLYVSDDGKFWAMGSNIAGQLGRDSTSHSIPEQIAIGVEMVTAGRSYSLYATNDGTLWAMGYNGYGQLGDGTTTSRSTPVQVATDAIAVTAGFGHSLFIKSDNTLWAMGYNGYGQLGDGTTTSRNTPVQIATDVIAVAAGSDHSLYITSDGKLWGMGYNGSGQLGNGNYTNLRTPVQIATNVIAVAAGSDHSLYVTSDGKLWAMGNNYSGQLGDGTTINRSTPVPVSSDVVAVAANGGHSLYVTDDGRLWGMGWNNWHQLGDGTTTNRTRPVQIATNVKSATAGYYHSLYITNDRNLWAMGCNVVGQLGDGTTMDRSRPVQIASDVIAVTAGYTKSDSGSDGGYMPFLGYSLYITSDNWLWSMGSNISGELGNGTWDYHNATPRHIEPIDLYVSSNGDDINDGLTPGTAKKSLDDILENIKKYNPCVIKVLNSENSVYVINKLYAICSGVTLNIEDGVIIKFADNAGFVVDVNGGLIGSNVIFSHIADDSIGGDTNGDGNRSMPAYDKYTITGPGTINISDSCEFRYRTVLDKTYGGTLSATETWKGRKIYRVTSSLTIPSGRTLTIEAGAIVKLSPGVNITVNSGGTLNANGTLQDKVIFTSIKDDAHGGDTNGDGKTTAPNMGDWNQIITSGTLNLNYCEILYGGDSPSGGPTSNNIGILRISGGVTTVNSCVFAHGKFDAISNDGGTGTFNNTVFWDFDRFTSYGTNSSTTIFTNCVFYMASTPGNGSYLMAFQGGTLRNCVVFKTKNFGSFNASYCVFGNPKDDGPQSLSAATSNNNKWGDPLFRDPGKGDFTLKVGSPCVDAANGSVAPERDHFGQTRVDDPYATNTGTPSANGAIPDIGIHEMTANAVTDVDIAISKITAPASATVGGSISITYTVVNVGQQAVQSAINSELFFVGEYGTRVSGSILSGDINLAPGESAELTASVKIPELADGNWYPRILINYDRYLFEGANTGNNSLDSQTAIQITQPIVSLGNLGMVNPFSAKTYKLDVAGGNNTLLITAPEGLSIYASLGGIPGADNHDLKAVWCGNNTYILTIPVATESLYLTVDNTSSATGKAISAEATTNALRLFSASLARIPNTGQATFTLVGIGLTENTTVQLKQGNTTIPSSSIRYISSTEIAVTVSPQYATAGNYDVVASNGTETATLPTTIQVKQTAIGPKLEAWLEFPDAVRQGRNIIGHICYQNTGDTDMPAPMFELSSTGQTFTVNGVLFSNKVRVMGLSTTTPVGTLRPGEMHRLPIEAMIGTNATNRVNWSLLVFHAGQTGMSDEIMLEQVVSKDWVYRISQSNPELFAKMCAKFGRTWAEFYRNLGAFADEYFGGETPAMTFDELVLKFADAMYFKIKEEEPAAEAAMKAAATGAGVVAMTETPCSQPDRLLETAKDEKSRKAAYKKDTSTNGDVWWWHNDNDCGWWHRATNATIKNLIKKGNVLLICHGNENSIHMRWIDSMARAAAASGHYTAVLAVDWGDWSIGESGFNGKNPEDTAPFIPDRLNKSTIPMRFENGVVTNAFNNLVECGITSGDNLTIVGHSHGGHVAGGIAQRFLEKNRGKVKRLVGLDSSPMWTHAGALIAYPYAWNGESAKQVEFYKTSWGFSMGTLESQSAEIFGKPSFFVTAPSDFYNDGYPPDRKGIKEAIGFIQKRDALSLHERAYEWFTQTFSMSTNAGVKWDGETEAKNLESWKALSGLVEATDVPSGGYAAVLRGNLMECGADVRTAVAAEIANGEVKIGDVNWRYGQIVLGWPEGAEGAPSNPPKSLAALQSYWGSLVEYSIKSITQVFPNEASDARRINMVVANQADNFSIDVDAPSFRSDLDKSIGLPLDGIMIYDMSSLPEDIKAKVGEGEWKRLSASDLEKLNANEVRKLSAGNAVFAVMAPGSQRKNVSYVVSPEDTKFPGRIHDIGYDPITGQPKEDGEECLFVCAVGMDEKAWNSGKLTPYYGELSVDNNVLAIVISNVKPFAQAVIHEGHFSRNTYPVPGSGGNTGTLLKQLYFADDSGAWSLNLNGAASQSRTQILSGAWSSADDCSITRAECVEHAIHSPNDTDCLWNTPANPNVIVSGILPKGSDGKPVPIRTYKVQLEVFADDGATGATEYTIVVVRKSKGGGGGGTSEPSGGGGTGQPGGGGSSTIPQSCDPNEMAGPLGAGEQRFVVPGQWLDFRIHFENMADATGAAQAVLVENDLSQYLDWGSFELGEIVFSNQVVNDLSGKKSGTLEVQRKNATDKVRIECSFDPQTGKAAWYLRSYDPTTGDNWPLDPYAGFLPPNDDTGRGEGYVAYRIKVKSDAPHNARIDSSAEIIFDTNDPITTDPAWWNTVYADGPTDPAIASQPSSAAKAAGGSATFTVSATGYEPLSYQWFKDGVALDGKTSATLNLPNLTAADTGNYTVTVTNIFRTVTSEIATLTVTTPPVIAWMPDKNTQTVQEGAAATFAVNVIEGSAPLTYKWSKNTVLIASATTATYTTPATIFADNGATFKVEVINSAGTASLNATLTVSPSPATLAQQAKAQLETPGAGTVTISGALDFSQVGGVTIASGKTIVGADANASITGIVTIPAGAKDVVILGVNFTDGALNINGATDVEVSHCTFTDAPVNITGGSDNITFSWNEFTATQTVNSEPGTVNPTAGSAMTINNAGATTGILLHHNLWGSGLKSDMPAVANARVVMFNNYFAATGNDTATIANAGAQILSQNNIHQNVNSPFTKQGTGKLRALDNFTLAPSGTLAPANDTVFVPAYSRLMYPAGINAPFDAATVAALITTNAGNTNGKNSITPATTANATAKITATVTGTTVPANATAINVPAGGNFTLTSAATGFTPADTRKWYLDNFLLTGVTGSTHTITGAIAATDAGAYSVALTTPAGEIVTSGAFTVTIGALTAPGIVTHPASQTTTVGQTASFFVTATGGAPLTYQWQKNSATWTNITGATATSYTIASAQSTDAANYRVLVMNSSGTATSNSATLTVNPAGSSGGGGGGGGGAVSIPFLALLALLGAWRAARAREKGDREWDG